MGIYTAITIMANNNYIIITSNHRHLDAIPSLLLLSRHDELADVYGDDDDNDHVV